MQLTSENVNKIFMNCLFKDKELKDGKPKIPCLVVEGITIKVGFHKGRIKMHKKDIHSRKGLLAMISKRRRLLHYLLKKDQDRYKKVVNDLDLPK